MLVEVRLRDLGVVADATIPLGPGLTVLTGETGAGKTMVLQGIGLLLGARADAALVRPGASRAVAEGRWRLPVGHPARVRAEALGAEDDDGDLVITRVLSAEGRSRCQVGGVAVPVAVLAEMADSLVAVHGQSDQQALLRPAAQRAALDAFGGAPVLAALTDYQQVYQQLAAARSLLAELEAAARERAQEAEALRHGLTRIEALNPVAGEEAELASVTARLGNADALRAHLTVIASALTGVDDDAAGPEGNSDQHAAAALGVVTRELAAAAALAPDIGPLVTRARALVAELVDLAADAAEVRRRLDADPAALAAAHERRAALTALTRVYAPDAAGLLSWADQARERLADLDGDDAERERLAATVGALTERLPGAARALSQARAEAAGRFGAAVTAELAALAMGSARVTVALRAQAPGPSGADEVELQLAANPQVPGRPLARSASGGELSRVMLAVEVVFAGADPVPTMVFDEVDAGVAGRAAVEVGRRLARLAQAHQVLVVTHLPQVAAFADEHLVVSKDSSGVIADTGVQPARDEARVDEVSRMLAGVADSALARGHAAELLALASSSR